MMIDAGWWWSRMPDDWWWFYSSLCKCLFLTWQRPKPKNYISKRKLEGSHRHTNVSLRQPEITISYMGQSVLNKPLYSSATLWWFIEIIRFIETDLSRLHPCGMVPGNRQETHPMAIIEHIQGPSSNSTNLNQTRTALLTINHHQYGHG